MNLIIKNRGSGKTTQLLYTSATTGKVIVAATNAACKYLKQMAKDLGVNIPEPISFYDFTNHKYDKNIIEDGILIDDLESILPKVLSDYFGVSIYAATMSNVSG